MEIQYNKKDRKDPNFNEREHTFLTCELPDGQSYRVPSANKEFIETNFIKGPYVSGETIINLGPNAMKDLDKPEIVLPDNEHPSLSIMHDNHRSLFYKRRQLMQTKGVSRSVLVVRVKAKVSTCT